MYTAKLLWFDLKQAMCCSWQDKFHLKSTFINKNPLEFHILIIFIHPPPFPIQTHTHLPKAGTIKLGLKGFRYHYSVNICKLPYLIVYSNWSNDRGFFCHVFSSWSLHRLFSSAQTCLATYIRGNTVLLDFEFGKS